MIHEVFELGRHRRARDHGAARGRRDARGHAARSARRSRSFRRTGFSRMPVYHEDPDTVVGIALLKDLVEPVAAGALRRAAGRARARSRSSCPETKPILDLLSEMRDVAQPHGGRRRRARRHGGPRHDRGHRRGDRRRDRRRVRPRPPLHQRGRPGALDRRRAALGRGGAREARPRRSRSPRSTTRSRDGCSWNSGTYLESGETVTVGDAHGPRGGGAPAADRPAAGHRRGPHERGE